MNRYTIEYWYGSYNGTQIVYAEHEDDAIRKMWQSLRPYMTLAMATQGQKVVGCEAVKEGD